MKLYDQCSDTERQRLQQLMDDMLPYYRRIAVYDIDKAFLSDHREESLRIALASRQVMASHTDMKPEEALFSDDQFAQLVGEAWQTTFSDADRLFFNAYLQHAAECFRLGMMMSELPPLG